MAQFRERGFVELRCVVRERGHCVVGAAREGEDHRTRAKTKRLYRSKDVFIGLGDRRSDEVDRVRIRRREEVRRAATVAPDPTLLRQAGRSRGKFVFTSQVPTCYRSPCCCHPEEVEEPLGSSVQAACRPGDRSTRWSLPGLLLQRSRYMRRGESCRRGSGQQSPVSREACAYSYYRTRAWLTLAPPAQMGPVCDGRRAEPVMVHYGYAGQLRELTEPIQPPGIRRMVFLRSGNRVEMLKNVSSWRYRNCVSTDRARFAREVSAGTSQT